MNNSIQYWTLGIVVLLASTTMGIGHILAQVLAAIRRLQTKADNQDYRLDAFNHQLAHHQHSKDN